jgi:very-short-patch-repair endonuclease
MAEKRLTSLARKMRNEPTGAEHRLWQHLRASQFCGAKFTRQFPIADFIADFACRSLKIAIELDGGQHADNSTDANRTRVIEAHGYRVIRFWNNEVLGNMDGVLQVIAQEIAIARNQTPLSLRGSEAGA